MHAASVLRASSPRKMPNVDGRGGKSIAGDARTQIHVWFRALMRRMRGVRVCCGDYERVLTPTVIRSTTRLGK